MADQEGVKGFPVPCFKYPISETKLFHFHGIFKKNEIKSAKRIPHTFINTNPISRNPGFAPGTSPINGHTRYFA